MSAITDSAKLADCEMRLPGVCCGDPEKTVWAHSNRAIHGKSAGKKAADQYGCYACYFCHMVYDRQFPRPKNLNLAMVEKAFFKAMKISQAILIRKGLWDGKTQGRAETKKRAPKSSKIQIPAHCRSTLQRAYLGKPTI